jgi:hypothetical protein
VTHDARRDRVRGALTGLAVGDAAALGAGRCLLRVDRLRMYPEGGGQEKEECGEAHGGTLGPGPERGKAGKPGVSWRG